TCTSPRSPQPSRPLPTPSSWSIKPAGTCPPVSSCRPISPSFCCRRSAQSSTRSRTSGSSCATTGSPTASSNPTTISSTIVVRHGTSSSISLGASCPSDCANGPTGSDQWDLVLVISTTERHAALPYQGSGDGRSALDLWVEMWVRIENPRRDQRYQ